MSVAIVLCGDLAARLRILQALLVQLYLTLKSFPSVREVHHGRRQLTLFLVLASKLETFEALPLAEDLIGR